MLSLKIVTGEFLYINKLNSKLISYLHGKMSTNQ